MILISVYRLQFVPIAEFMSVFGELLESFVIFNEDFVIAGDVNVHVESDECASKKFKDLLDLFDLEQHVVGPTHIMGHTIDVIITPNKTNYVTGIEVRQIDLSHHFLIDFKVKAANVINNTSKIITYRNLKNMDNVSFCNEFNERYLSSPVTNGLKDTLNFLL